MYLYIWACINVYVIIYIHIYIYIHTYIDTYITRTTHSKPTQIDCINIIHSILWTLSRCPPSSILFIMYIILHAIYMAIQSKWIWCLLINTCIPEKKNIHINIYPGRGGSESRSRIRRASRWKKKNTNSGLQKVGLLACCEKKKRNRGGLFFFPSLLLEWLLTLLLRVVLYKCSGKDV